MSASGDGDVKHTSTVEEALSVMLENHHDNDKVQAHSSDSF